MCRCQKFFLLTGRDEELLARGLELNDGLQSLLAKHDAIALGSPLAVEATGVSPKRNEASSSNKSSEAKSPAPNISPPTPVATVTKSHIDEEEEEEDDFAQLARRFRMLTSNSPYFTCCSPTNDYFYVRVYGLSLGKILCSFGKYH